MGHGPFVRSSSCTQRKECTSQDRGQAEIWQGTGVWVPNMDVAPGSGADVCAYSGPFRQKKSRIVDVAPGSGADVCANSGPFNRERVASWKWLRALVRTSVPIPVSLTEKESHSGTMGHASVPFRHASGVAVSSPMGVGCTGWPAERQ